MPLAFLQGIGAAWDSLDVEVESIGETADGTVFVVTHLSGTRKGGEPPKYGAAHVFNVRDGKIVRFRE